MMVGLIKPFHSVSDEYQIPIPKFVPLGNNTRHVINKHMPSFY